MNTAHWPLVIYHLPIIIPAIGFLLMISSLIFKSELLKRAGYSMFILEANTAIVFFSTGEGVGKIVEEIQAIDRQFIKTHQEIA